MLKFINCSKAYDGQDALKNGLYDSSLEFPPKGNLYRTHERDAAVYAFGRYILGPILKSFVRNK